MHLVRTLFQIALGAALTYAGITHLTTSRTEFQAQVPTIVSFMGTLEHGWMEELSSEKQEIS
jgi:uncharacterized membrane protein